MFDERRKGAQGLTVSTCVNPWFGEPVRKEIYLFELTTREKGIPVT